MCTEFFNTKKRLDILLWTKTLRRKGVTTGSGGMNWPTSPRVEPVLEWLGASCPVQAPIPWHQRISHFQGLIPAGLLSLLQEKVLLMMPMPPTNSIHNNVTIKFVFGQKPQYTSLFMLLVCFCFVRPT